MRAQARATAAHSPSAYPFRCDAGEFLTDALRHAGHDVSFADSALTAAVSFRPDIAVLDIGLPDMDGYDLAARLRAQSSCAHTRLIALTGYGQDQDRRRSQAAGFTHHIVKPVDIKRLLELVSAEPAQAPH